MGEEVRGPRRVIPRAIPIALLITLVAYSAVATAAVLLSLLTGVGRTVFAMSDRGDLPRALSALDTTGGVPRRAEVVVGLVVTALVISIDLRDAIAFSAVTVLGYYAITNAASLTVPRAERRWPRPVPVLGLVGCVTLAVSLQPTALIAGVIVLTAAGLIATLRHGARGWHRPVLVD